MSLVLDRPAASPRHGRRIARAALALAIGLGTVAAFVPAASAAPGPIVSSELHWGIKTSFRSYITGIAAGTVTPSNGASFEGEPASANKPASRPYLWTGAGGTVDPTTNATTAAFDGTVSYRSTSHTIWHIRIEDLQVELGADGQGVLRGDYSASTGGTEAEPETSGAKDDVVLATLATSGAPASNGQTVTYTNVTATLTQDGSDAFAGQYAAGVVVDPLTFTVSLGDGIAPAAPTVTVAKVTKANQTAVPVSGTGEPGAVVALSVDDVSNATPAVIGATNVLPDGTWTTTLDLSTLREGSIVATAKLADQAGNVSAPGTGKTTKSTGNTNLLITSLLEYVLALVGL